MFFCDLFLGGGRRVRPEEGVAHDCLLRRGIVGWIWDAVRECWGGGPLRIQGSRGEWWMESVLLWVDGEYGFVGGKSALETDR